MRFRILAFIVSVVLIFFAGSARGQTVPGSSSPERGEIGHTEIMTWQDGKNGAVSITWDDGSLNQFRVAAPILDELGLPAT